MPLEWNFVKRLQYLLLCRHNCLWNGQRQPQYACWGCQCLYTKSAVGTYNNNECVWTIYHAGDMSNGRKPCIQKGPIYGFYMLSNHEKFYPLDMRCDFKSNKLILTILHFYFFYNIIAPNKIFQKKIMQRTKQKQQQFLKLDKDSHTSN